MNVLRLLLSVAVLLLLVASFEQQTLHAQQKIPGYGPNAKACALLPIPELEAFYHGKAGTPRGFDESGGSICEVWIAGHISKVQFAPPGDEGAPHSIREGFALIPEIAAANKGKAKFETKDYGKVGCLKLELSPTALGADAPKGQKLAYAVNCFQVEGGFLNLTLSSDDPAQISFDTAKQFLEKAAARRKT